jgi:hypothetical protein
MEDYFFIKFTLLSILTSIAGIAIKVYLLKTGIDDSRRLLGIGVLGIKLIANVLILIGAFCFIILCIAFFYYLKYRGYI